MEMSQIRYVLAAPRLLNFTRAAAECNVTQPALTKGIKTLEAEFGAPPFHREGKHILLSDFGRSMLPRLQHIAEEAMATKVLAQNFRLLEQVPVRLGVMSTIGHLRLARFLSRFEKEHGGLELAVTEGTLPDIRDRLFAGDIDVGVMTGLQDIVADLNTAELYTERYVVVFPPEHRLGRSNAISLRDLSGEHYVDRLSCEMREMVMAVCEEKGVELYARFRSEREDWVQAMVLAGIGFAFMPEYSVTLPGLIQRPLIEPAVERRIVTATVPGRKFSPAVEALMRSTQTFAWPG
ncbi:LysR family transcriptional regulator [Solirhodobacter olei]|uniref:LysR family transcriptional regulator n=1 Tax=Solirhodobacter olei TaxID=2493082 RepID=UPI0013E2CD86|nr:LysR family transcriptional regulator [Solirhodobacter olei]